MQASDWMLRFRQEAGEFGRNLVHNFRINRRPVPDPDVRLDGKTVIVTGSNRTMGKEIAEDLASRGAKVIMACRNLQLAEEAADDIRSRVANAMLIVKHLDLASLQSVADFANSIVKEEERLDVLVNNAAVWIFKERQETADGYEMMFGVNYLGTAYLSILLLDHISKTSDSGRIVSTASIAHYSVHDIYWNSMTQHLSKNPETQKKFSAITSYGASKLALLLFTRSLAKRAFPKHNVRIYAVDPGVSPTDLFRDTPLQIAVSAALFFWRPALRSVKEAANSVVSSVLSDPNDYSPDVYYFSDGIPNQMSRFAQDDEKAERLWKVTSELLDLPDMLTL